MNAHIAMLALVLGGSGSAAAQHPQMPQGTSHEQHMAEMKKRGNAAMGFDQDKTAHHFLLARDGGSIEVGARAADDEQSRQQIRTHLREISEAFGRGDFEKPLATHGEMPPGVGTMQQLKGAITYTFEETEQGGRVRIRTSDAKALAAVHEFLRYQIKEHATGDPTTVK